MEVLAGSTIQSNVSSAFGINTSSYLNGALISSIAFAAKTSVAGNTYTDYKYSALFGRIGYSWDDKYLLNLTGRRDGSSRFGPSKQFGNFGAAGATWIFSKEKFMRNTFSFLSFGKLRTSYGTTGNDQITDYQYLSTYSSTGIAYQSVTGLFPNRIANPYFGWEVVKKLEGGIELGFLKDKIIVSGSYYRNRSGNQLVGYVCRWLNKEQAWRFDGRLYKKECENEIALYHHISNLVENLSGERERGKARVLIEKANLHQKILAFDSTVITVDFIKKIIDEQASEIQVIVATGQKSSGKKKVTEYLGLEATHNEKVIALCSDAMSEGINL